MPRRRSSGHGPGPKWSPAPDRDPSAALGRGGAGWQGIGYPDLRFLIGAEDLAADVLLVGVEWRREQNPLAFVHPGQIWMNFVLYMPTSTGLGSGSPPLAT